MPPKRTRGAANQAPDVPKQRQSKLAKEHNISASEEAEIQEAFNLFSQSIPDPSTTDRKGKGKASEKPATISVLPKSSIRKSFTALGFSISSGELKDFMYVLDPENEGYTTYEAFVGVAALKIRAKDDNEDEREEEIDQGFELFTQGAEKITMRDLQRIAKLLKEDVDEGVLNDMILEANGGRGVGTGVDRVAFGDVMRRAGVFR